MRKAENINAPNLRGWTIGVAAGLVTFGALMILGRFNLFPAAFLGGLVALLTGLILSMFWGARAPQADVAAPAAAPPADTVPAAAATAAALLAEQPAPPAPRIAEAMAAPAAPVSAAPVSAAPVSAAPVAEAPPDMPPDLHLDMPAADPIAETRPGAAPAAGPERLKAARWGRADDLKEIEGIGPALEKLLNQLGFYHFDQIAGWTDADVALVDAEMKSFKGRIARDRWVAQARLIVSEGLEAFRIRAKTNDY